MCIDILPHWQDYQSDPRNELDTFLKLLEEDLRAIEERYQIEFGNPSVKKPADESRAYAEELRVKWDPDKADKAALALAKSLMFAYKTAAAHLIIAARNSIENCQNDQVFFYLEKHKEARNYYGTAKNTSLPESWALGMDIAGLVDKAIQNYCSAIRTVMLAFC